MGDEAEAARSEGKAFEGGGGGGGGGVHAPPLGVVVVV